MALSDSRKIAFLIWNTFQLLHFKTLLQALPDSCLIIEQRKRSIPIDPNILADISNTVIYVKQKELCQIIDGKFDILVIQTVFEQIDLLKKTKIAMLQYGYAKAAYNYDCWRSFADLNLVYGQHAFDAISYFSPTETIGCPRYDQWFDVNFHLQSHHKYTPILDKSRKTILYAPSWGELSSFNLYIDQIHKLNTNYNVLVKMHHNSILLSDISHNWANTFGGIHFFYENEDLISLLSVADIVISDFSGAIFDALFCRKPVVLLNIPDISKVNKVDSFSLEISQRTRLGIEVNKPEDLPEVVDKISSSLVDYKIDEKLYHNLFTETEYATKQAIACLIRLMNGNYILSQQQQYIRRTVCELYAERRKVADRNKPFSKMKRFFKKLR